jgi:hypothetical protein
VGTLTVAPYITVDAAFTGTKVTLRPYPRNDPSPAHALFNKVQSSARMVIEQAWGMLAAKFAIFGTAIEVKGDPVDWRERVRNIILASMILHNMCRNLKEFDAALEGGSDSEHEDDASDNEIYLDVPRAEVEAQIQEHSHIRNAICTSLYNTHYLNENNVIRRQANGR